MNLINELKKGHSKAICTKIVSYVGSEKVRFNELVEVFLNGPYRITQRAAWPLSYCVINHPDLVKPYLGKLILQLDRPGQSDAVKRNTLRLLQHVDIPARHHGGLVSRCFDYLNNSKEPVAIRVFAMTVLANISKKQPDLMRELRLVIEDQLPNASSAFKSRARKVLR